MASRRTEFRDAIERCSRDQLLELVALWNNTAHSSRAQEQDDAGVREMLMTFWDTPGASKVIKGRMIDHLRFD